MKEKEKHIELEKVDLPIESKDATSLENYGMPPKKISLDAKEGELLIKIKVRSTRGTILLSILAIAIYFIFLSRYLEPVFWFFILMAVVGFLQKKFFHLPFFQSTLKLKLTEDQIEYNMGKFSTEIVTWDRVKRISRKDPSESNKEDGHAILHYDQWQEMKIGKGKLG